MQPPEADRPWQPFPDLDHVVGGISLKRDGAMSWNGETREEIVQNRQRYFELAGIDPRLAVGREQVHGATVYRVTPADKGRGILERDSRIPGTDALMTDERGIILTTPHADCAPVFFADPEHHAIALAHAGRCGILAGIAAKVLRSMADAFGTDPQTVHVAIGPTICTHAYEVDSGVAGEFAARFGPQMVLTENGKFYLDLVASIVADLLEAGLNPSAIPLRPLCTATNPQFASYRRDGAPVRSMLSWLSMT